MQLVQSSENVEQTFDNSYLLNASGATIAFNKLNILNRGHKLGDEVLCIKDQSLEQPPGLNRAGELRGECDSIHIP